MTAESNPTARAGGADSAATVVPAPAATIPSTPTTPTAPATTTATPSSKTSDRAPVILFFSDGTKKDGAASPLSGIKLAALVGLVAGAAAVGTGAYFGFRSVEANDTATQHCQMGTAACDERGQQLRASADQWRNAATASMAVGGGLLLTGGILFGLSHLRGGSKKVEMPKLGRVKIEPGLGQLHVKATF